MITSRLLMYICVPLYCHRLALPRECRIVSTCIRLCKISRALSQPNPTHPIPTCPIPAHPIPSHPIPAQPSPAQPSPSCPVLSHPNPFNPDQSHLWGYVAWGGNQHIHTHLHALLARRNYLVA